MPNSPTTLTSSACETTGSPSPLGYGYVWATGKRHAYYLLQNTGLWGLDGNTHVGFWLLGDGEWDGNQSLWINDKLTWNGNTDVVSNWLGQRWYKTLDYPNQDIVFNFHSGCDAVIGSGLTPTSNGPDQGCDVLWAQFPPAIQPLCFSRIAYYSIMRAQPVLWQTTGYQQDPSQWTDIAPIGLWRALRARLFDADGNVTGYAWTRNPIWHYVDAHLRRKLFPDYSLTYQVGPDPLPTDVSNRFDWPTLFNSAQACDALLANGQPRFSGDYLFSQGESLQAMKTQMLRVCRGFERITQGKLGVVVDMPRSSVFTFSREHLIPDSFEADDQALTTGGNRYVSKFRDLLIPAASVIAGIAFTIGSDPEVTTVEPHPFQPNDIIAMGGTGTVYDGEWTVSSVPDIINPGTVGAIYPSTFTVAQKGANYPSSVGSGGAIGLTYSRFKERSPEFWHKQNMLARGAVAPGVARQRNKIKETPDFATSTYDQVARVSLYERDRTLGFDQSPYQTPPRFRFRTSMFARDASGNLAAAIQPGDVITCDETFRYPYAGKYEVLDGFTITPPACELAGTGIGRAPDPSSGEISLPVQSYSDDYLYDASSSDAAEWPNVPNSYPGNDSAFQAVPLANGGNFVFFTGQLPSGTPFQLPSTGYPAANLLAWASPAGANVSFHSAHFVQLCDFDSNRLLSLIYSDGSVTWGGDVNYGGLTWLSSDVSNTDSNGMTWLPLTLLGGEEILFGTGVLADGATITLPSGWSTAQCFANAFIHDQPASGHIMFLAGAYVDGSFVVHVNASDDSGHTWHGNARVLVFAWNNNMGTVTSTTLHGRGGSLDPVTWLGFPLPSSRGTFMVGCAKAIPDLGLLAPQPDAIDGWLEAMLGSSDGSYEVGSNHAQGIGACNLDQSNQVHMTFNNGSGDVWSGSADIFATYLQPPAAPQVYVSVTPASASMVAGSTLRFRAQVVNDSDQSVTWWVDGILGGNTSVGTIDATGLYSAPNAPGTHTVMAVGGPGDTCEVGVNVYGTQVLSGSPVTDAAGNLYYMGTEVLYFG